MHEAAILNTNGNKSHNVSVDTRSSSSRRMTFQLVICQYFMMSA